MKKIIAIIGAVIVIFAVSDWLESDNNSDGNITYDNSTNYEEYYRNNSDLNNSNRSNYSDYSNYSNDDTTSVKVQCSICKGSGTRVCFSCDGTGKLYRTKYSIDLGGGSNSYQVSQTCKACNGTGYIMCTYCLGKGYQ